VDFSDAFEIGLYFIIVKIKVSVGIKHGHLFGTLNKG